MTPTQRRKFIHAKARAALNRANRIIKHQFPKINPHHSRKARRYRHHIHTCQRWLRKLAAYPNPSNPFPQL